MQHALHQFNLLLYIGVTHILIIPILNGVYSRTCTVLTAPLHNGQLRLL